MRKMAIRFAVAAALALGFTAPAGALEFYFDGYGGFTDPAEISPTTPDAAFPNPEYAIENTFDTDVKAWQHFGWGTPVLDEHSHATLNEIDPLGDPLDPDNFDDHVTGSITVDDPTGESIGRLTHHNLRIEEIFGPANVAIHYHLDIYADSDKTQLLFETGPLDFTLEFWETANSEACPPTGGDEGPKGSSCDDRFRYGDGWISTEIGDTLEKKVGEFTYEDILYEIILSGFMDSETGELSPEFWSPENSDPSTAEVLARIRVPEPGAWSLLATGLTGLVAFRLRGGPRARS